MLSAYLTWFLLALIPVVPVVLAFVPGLDEPRSGGEDEPAPPRDDTRLDDPPAAPREDEAGPVLMAV